MKLENLLSTQAKVGQTMGERAVAWGSVAMELHPAYPHVMADLHRRKIEVVRVTQGDPHVELIHHAEKEPPYSEWRLVCPGRHAIH